MEFYILCVYSDIHGCPPYPCSSCYCFYEYIVPRYLVIGNATIRETQFVYLNKWAFTDEIYVSI
ncbi:hypothetical protein BBL07_17490 [Agrobacterium vitis]|nr:hypothetical protein BBL07_17490 [Agrobacterium vitis]